MYDEKDDDDDDDEELTQGAADETYLNKV